MPAVSKKKDKSREKISTVPRNTVLKRASRLYCRQLTQSLTNQWTSR